MEAQSLNHWTTREVPGCELDVKLYELTSMCDCALQRKFTSLTVSRGQEHQEGIKKAWSRNSRAVRKERVTEAY